MTYLLDTNVCIRFLTGRAKSVNDRFYKVDPEEIVLCSIVRAELRYGALRAQHPALALRDQNLFIEQFFSYPLDDEAAEEAGRLRAMLASRGTPIGPYDYLIAAIAIVNDLTLVTHNVGEFGRIPNLKIDDWESA